LDAWAEVLRVTLPALLAGLVGWYGHRLLRRTGHEQAAATVGVGELAATTARLLGEIETLKATQTIYEAYAKGQATLVDTTRADLATERQARAVAELRDVECQRRLTRAEARIDALFRATGRRREGMWDDYDG
jgi:hypothetical protein